MDTKHGSSRWAEGVSVTGLYYDGVLEESKLQELLELHKRYCMFGTRSSRRVAKIESTSNTVKAHTWQSHNPVWEHPLQLSLGRKANTSLVYCQYGVHYYKSKPHTSGRVFVQATRKKGCLAPAHYKCHPTKEVMGFAQRVHPELIAKGSGTSLNWNSWTCWSWSGTTAKTSCGSLHVCWKFPRSQRQSLLSLPIWHQEQYSHLVLYPGIPSGIPATSWQTTWNRCTGNLLS